MYEPAKHYHLGCGESLYTGICGKPETKTVPKDVVNRFVSREPGRRKKTERSK